MKKFNLTILGIDTSCDETAISILKFRGSNLEIASNVVSSQVKIHAPYGGVYPFLAKREHQKNLPLVFQRAMEKAKNPKIDLIAVTIGPGLEPCLWQGINFAKELAKKLKLPLLPINHIEAHIMANWLRPNIPKIIFPALCLVVSGGHSQLILMKKFADYKILGQTRDDAAGECLDKVARILGLGYPGGPAIAKMAHLAKNGKIKLPRPMIDQKNYDFSFSGLKTAVFYDFKSRSQKERSSKIYRQEMAKEVQQAIIDVLISKTMRAAREYKVKSIILGGGVAANDQLRKQMKKACLRWNLKCWLPKKKFCTDNGAMVAITAYYQWLMAKKFSFKRIKANANLRIG